MDRSFKYPHFSVSILVPKFCPRYALSASSSAVSGLLLNAYSASFRVCIFPRSVSATVFSIPVSSINETSTVSPPTPERYIAARRSAFALTGSPRSGTSSAAACKIGFPPHFVITVPSLIPRLLTSSVVQTAIISPLSSCTIASPYSCVFRSLSDLYAFTSNPPPTVTCPSCSSQQNRETAS